MRKPLLFLLIFIAVASSNAQSFWQKTTEVEAARSGKKTRTSFPVKQQFYRLDRNAFNMALSTAPMRGQTSNLVIELPDADGKIQHFRIWEAPVMHRDLAAKYPDIKSYVGQGIENRSSIIRFSNTLFGLHAMTLAADNGTYYIDPYSSDGQYYMIYARQGLTSSRTFQCHVSENQPTMRPAEVTSPQDNGNYRTYRTGIVATVEFSAFHIAEAGLESGTLAQKKAAVLAAIAITVTRVNSMFERDLSVFFELIPNEDDVIFIDTDNLTDDDVGELIDETQETLDEIIGSENYDFGHGVGTSGGGLGGGTPCIDGQKAFGATGLGSPVGDPFDIDYVAHEMGHQFGAAHTFNNECGGNRSDNWAYEPGSGSSIMAYAGICDPNIQSNSNAQFFAGSITQIRNTINGAGGSCITPTPNNNSRPTADAGKDYTIPFGTAFILTGAANDADNDALTYMWEQYDNEISVQPPSNISPDGPNFKPQVITEIPVRYLPELPSVLSNNLTPTWEVISDVGREYNFAFTVRDNNPGGGESRTDFMKVSVAGTAGPFVITTPNTNVNWTAASNQIINWNVAGTTANGVDTPNVDILLSTNGGLDFNVTLAQNVPNDGSENITIPNLPGNANRIVVRGNGNIFYDVSNQNFTISAAAATFLFNSTLPQFVNACQGATATYQFDYENLGGFADTTTFSVTGLPAGAIAAFNPTTTAADGTIQLTIGNMDASSVGLYPITVTATSGSIVKTSSVYLNLLDNTFAGVTLTNPANLASGVGLTHTFEWTADANASAYTIVLSTSEDFTGDVMTATVQGNTHTFSGLSESTLYYWAVRPENAGCTGVFGAASTFATGVLICSDYSSGDVPVEIPDNAEVTVASTLTMTDDFDIQSATVTLDITHTWMGDIAAKLISPTGTAINLFSHQCGDADDVSATFSDSGVTLICNGEPVISGTLQPETPLDILVGESSAGVWTLEIFDEFAADGGSINSWSLNLCRTVVALATPEATAIDFAIYPNPNNGSFSIRGQNAISQFRIYDLRGRLIYNQLVNLSGNWTQNIDLRVEAGVYLVEASGEGNKTVKRFIVK